MNRFGKLTITKHGEELMRELIDEGWPEHESAILVNGRDAVQMALWKAPWPQAPSEDALAGQIAVHLPDDCEIMFLRGETSDMVVINQILTVLIPKRILPDVTPSTSPVSGE